LLTSLIPILEFYMYGINFIGGIIFGGALATVIVLSIKRQQRKRTTEKKE
jgi:hypothetical protein